VTSPQPAVVAIAGPIGSGKTTISTLIAAHLGWPRAAYGDLIRSVAASRGYPPDRHHLQQIGTELITTGWDAFTGQVLSQAAWTPSQPLILDGLRHAAGADALTRIVAPMRAVVVYLDIPAAVAAERARLRDHQPETSRPDLTHPVELDLHAVRSRASVVLAAGGIAPGDLAAQILSHLSAPWRWLPAARDARNCSA
jgi:cytidylate kinase